jgi:hypothetical protein
MMCFGFSSARWPFRKQEKQENLGKPMEKTGKNETETGKPGNPCISWFSCLRFIFS